MVNLGLRAHDFMIDDDVEQLAGTIEKSGIHFVQFANNISLAKTTDNGRKINAGLGLQVKNIFAKHSIEIGVLSSYFNVIHPDEKLQVKGMDQFKHYLKTASNYGANIVATEPGSVDPTFKLTVDNYKEEIVEKTIGNIKELVGVAEKVGISVGIEAGVNHPIHSLETIKKMFDEVNSPALKLILDPVNLLNEENKDQVYKLLEDGLMMFGENIHAIHVKDYTFQETKEIVTPGKGEMDFEKFFGIIEKYQPGSLVILDEAPRENLESGIQNVKKFSS